MPTKKSKAKAAAQSNGALPQQASVSVMTVTPAMATDWLQRNIAKNRKIVSSVVLRYAEDIRAGRWQMNGSTIVMAESGMIIDGQHRLMAVVQAGRPIETLVASGIPDAGFETIDSGRRRIPSDVLSIMGYTNVVQLAALANMSLMWEKHNSLTLPGGKTYATATTQEIVARVVRDHEIYEKALSIGGAVRRLFGGGAVHAFYWIKLGEIDESDRDFFFERLVDGQALTLGDPVYALRQALLNARLRNRAVSPNHMGGLIIKAWNRYRNHEKVQVLSFNALEDYPTPI